MVLHLEPEFLPIERNVPLAPLTSLQLGGVARFFARVDSVAGLRKAIQFAREQSLPFTLLGGGSNTIVPDDGFPGLVIQIRILGIEFDESPRGVACPAQSVIVEAGAGEDWDRFVRTMTEQGLGGVECLSGIPGSVGATPVQNVGAYGQEVSETIECVRALDIETLEQVEFSCEECNFSYRSSRFKGPDRGRFVIVRVRFRLEADGRPQLRYRELRQAVEASVPTLEHLPAAVQLQAIRDVVLRLRRRKSMVLDPEDPNSRSAGSFFLNPILTAEAMEEFEARCFARFGENPPKFAAENGCFKTSAAWLIERAGFVKGQLHDGIGISQNHSLALVNRGGSTRALLDFAERIRRQVEDQFGVRLEREPVILGA